MIRFKIGARVIARHPLTNDFEHGVIVDLEKNDNLILVDFFELEHLLDCAPENVFMTDIKDYIEANPSEHKEC